MVVMSAAARFSRLVKAAAVLFLVQAMAPVMAQQNLRDTFPGRRIGGGTRGECAARFVINLVPRTSVFAPGPAALIAVLHGPSRRPMPLALSFRSYEGEGSFQSNRLISRRLESPSPASLLLFKISDMALPLVWESSYQCEPDQVVDELAFLGSDAPAAVSLLVDTAQSEDQVLQSALTKWHKVCGGSVPVRDVVETARLEGLDLSRWPSQLPVHCP